MPRVDLGLAVKRQVIGVLSDQDLRDRRLGKNAALDDPRRSRCLDDRALARAVALSPTATDQNAEGDGHHVETLCNILADLMKGAVTIGVPLVLDNNDLLDPPEMGRQQATFDLSRGRSAEDRLALSTAYWAFAKAVSTSKRASSNVSADGTRPCAGLDRREFRGADGGLASGYRAVKRGSYGRLPGWWSGRAG